MPPTVFSSPLRRLITSRSCATDFHSIMTNLMPAYAGWSTYPMACLDPSGADHLALWSSEC